MALGLNLNDMLAVRMYERSPIGVAVSANSNLTAQNARATAYYVRDAPSHLLYIKAYDYELQIRDTKASYELSLTVARQQNWITFQCDSLGQMKETLSVNFNLATHVLTEWGSYCNFSTDNHRPEFEDKPIASLIRPYDDVKRLLAKQGRIAEEVAHPTEPTGKMLILQQPTGYR